MKKSFLGFASLCVAALFISACASVVSQPSIQELIVQGRFDEAMEIFKTKTDINAADENGKE